MGMLEQAWAFLTDPEHRAVLAWLGGGLVVVLGGAWTAFTYFHRRGGTDPRATQGPSTSVEVIGGVGSGHDVRARDITISGSPPSTAARPEPSRPTATAPGTRRGGAKPRKKRRRR